MCRGVEIERLWKCDGRDVSEQAVEKLYSAHCLGERHASACRYTVIFAVLKYSAQNEVGGIPVVPVG